MSTQSLRGLAHRFAMTPALAVLCVIALCGGSASATNTRQCLYNSDCATPLVCSDTGLCREQCHEDRDCRTDRIGAFGQIQGGMCRNLTYDWDSTGHYVPVPPSQARTVIVGGSTRWPARDHDTCLQPNSPYWPISRPPGMAGIPSGGSISVAPATVSVVPAAQPAAIMPGINLPGMDMGGAPTPNDGGTQCRLSCLANAQCKAFSWVRPGVQGPQAMCWLKGAVPSARVKDNNVNSGILRP